jgi:hypothetical protein
MTRAAIAPMIAEMDIFIILSKRVCKEQRSGASASYALVQHAGAALARRMTPTGNY